MIGFDRDRPYLSLSPSCVPAASPGINILCCNLTLFSLQWKIEQEASFKPFPYLNEMLTVTFGVLKKNTQVIP